MTMQKPTIPTNEEERIEILRRLLILDTEPEERFDNVTAYAASAFNVPICLITLVDTDRLWFKSSYGLPGVRETVREATFCAHTILQDKVLEVRDALQDETFVDCPLVTGKPYIRFYAAFPLTMEGGQRVGTLCLISPQPKRLDDWERAHLEALAKLVSAELQGFPVPQVPGFNS